jgi:hypothetical protein
MPLGTYHRLIGEICLQKEGYYLVCGQGYWNLTLNVRPTQLIGTSVIVEGYRNGFNSLEVRTIQPLNGSWEDFVFNMPWWERLLMRWGWVRER